MSVCLCVCLFMCVCVCASECLTVIEPKQQNLSKISWE